MSRYANLSREQLVAKLESLNLDSDLQPTPSPVAGPSKAKVPKPRKAKAFNFSAHPTRHVALLVSYHGWPYSGLAIQTEEKGIVTVEGELLKALEKTRLIEEGKGWEGCGFSRCGRTDAGVSGAGQVLSLWVRSNRKQPGLGWKESSEPMAPLKVDENGRPLTIPYSGEFAYPRLLNGVLPPAIRVLAWSPIAEDFDARFSCKLRHYKYAFHLRPTPSSPDLDLDLMREGCKRLIGEHDFRNFCKLDGSKQIESHSRRVIDAWFGMDEAYPGMVVFNLVGTAFLWHQVRHIIAVLFLLGSKLEKPDLVTELLDVSTNPAKPTYQMGSPLPLTLHECGFEQLDWRAGGFDGTMADITAEEMQAEKGSRAKLERGLEEVKQDMEIRAWQVGNALRRTREIFGETKVELSGSNFPVGGGDVLSTINYRPVMERPRGEEPDEVNRKWREKNPKKVWGAVDDQA